MVTPATAHLLPPKSWDEFEDICADLFGKQWEDPNATRYGRQGQRQSGVDIYGKLANGETAGVQCKGRRRWPPRALRTSEIDTEVERAKNFRTRLTEFTIATVAPDDAKIQDHARAITARHEPEGLFSVYVIGWDEITRRLTHHSDLIEKHFGFISLSTIHAEVPDKTAELVVERLVKIGAVPKPDAAEEASTAPVRFQQLGLIDAVERDLANRYDHALRRSLFPEARKTDDFQLLAQEVVERKFSAISPSLQRCILLRAARSTAVRSEIEASERFLSAAQAMPGEDSHLPAEARLAEAKGDIGGAIQLLRDQTDADCRSTLLNILFKNRGNDAALEWFNQCGSSVADLTANGVHTLAVAYLHQHDVEKAREVLAAATGSQFSEGPFLLFLRAAVRLACLFSKPDQGLALQGHLPLDVRSASVVAPDEVAAEELDLAISDLTRLLPVALELGLSEARRIAEAYVVWCKLLHPHRRANALVQLRTDMAEPKTALRQLQFAFAYEPEFDPAPVARYLEKRDEFGGLDDQELCAALVLRLNGKDPKPVAELIAKHRSQFEASLGKPGILSIEIQALAMANEVTAARISLDQNRGLFDANSIAALEVEIAKSEGADPVQEHLRAYEAIKTPEMLRALVRALAQSKDHSALARYAEELHRHTNDPQDISLAAEAFANAGDSGNFVRLVESHTFLTNDYPTLARHYAWQLFYSGRLTDAKRQTDQMRSKSPAYRDLNLEIAIAIESGDWETVVQPLTAFLDKADSVEASALIRAAHIAQVLGQGPMMDLMRAAIEKGGEDPDVLLGAYVLTIEEGLEDTIPDANEWFRRAVDLSGEDGPIKRFELKELLPRQVQWSEHSRKVNEGIVHGDFPLAIAAPGLRTTLVDVVLHNLVRNSALADPRRRAPIPVFTGRRTPAGIGEVQRLGLDVTALMILGWLGLLPKVLRSFSEFVLPAGAMQELFDGRRRIRQFQKSRLKRAAEVRDAIASGRVKVLRAAAVSHDELADEVGPQLAVLIRAAEAADGVVLRPAPALRPGLDMDEADLSAHSGCLADMHSLLAALNHLGVLDQATEDTAKGYFSIQDRGWPSPVRPEPTRPLFIDDLALTYLQSANLFASVIESFSDVYVEASAQEEAASLSEYDRHTEDVLRVIDDVREAIREARANDKVIFGPRRSRAHEDEAGPDPSTIHLLFDLKGADAVVFDDRALNKEQFAQDRSGHRARTVTSLDVIEELLTRKLISEVDHRTCRHRLRIGGAALMPADVEEITLAALRSRSGESREFRAIREAVDLARISEVPRFPSEIPWFGSFALSAKNAVMQVWMRERDTARAAALADMIVDLSPKPEDWVARWEGQAAPEWVDAVTSVLTSSLAMAVELSDDQVLKAYGEWVERKLLTPIRFTAPDRYQAIVDHVRSFIMSSADNGNDDAS